MSNPLQPASQQVSKNVRDRLAELGVLIDEQSQEILVRISAKNDFNINNMKVIYDKPIKIQKIKDEKLQELISDYRLQSIGNKEAENEVVSDLSNVTTETSSAAAQLLDALLVRAMDLNASDVHITSEKRKSSAELRVDGSIEEVSEVSGQLVSELIARIKLLSSLNPVEKRRPQDGALKINLSNSKSIECRVSAFPLLQGERLVLRIFNDTIQSRTLEEMGFLLQEVNELKASISHQSGLVIIAGPTGSGKTTTIYALIEKLTNSGLNIMTIEDPVERQLVGVRQSQVNEGIGFGFSDGLRSILRQDPDVIIVGEIRDSETAKIAVRAALTGHLVISTVHARTGLSVLGRLEDLGVSKGLIEQALVAIHNQRLFRLYCPSCGATSSRSPAHDSLLPIRLEGCESCRSTGFWGRTGRLETFEQKDGRWQMVSQGLFEKAMKMYEDGKLPRYEVEKTK